MTRRRIRTEPRRFWTEAEDELLRREYPHRQTRELLSRLPGRTRQSVYARAATLGLAKTAAYLASPAARRLDGVTGIASRFRPGHTSWNKGTHYVPGGRAAETQFKAGELPHNHAPIGTTVKSTDGYWKVKVGEPKAWRWCHRLAWEEVNGPIPSGMCLVFRDGNTDNYALGNLELVPREALMRRNSLHNYPAPLPQLIQLRGALVRKINRRAAASEEPNR